MVWELADVAPDPSAIDVVSARKRAAFQGFDLDST